MHIMMIANDTRFLYNLRREVLAGLLEEGYTVSVVGQNLGFQEEFAQMGVRLLPVTMERRGTNPLSDLELFAAFRRILRDEKPDIVLTNNIKPNVYGGFACKMMGIPYISNITGLGTAVEKPGKLQKLTTLMYKAGVSGASTVFFQNQENLDFFRDRGMLASKTKVRLLPGSGVNLSAHPVMEYPREGEVNFLFVARIMKEKGIDLFLAAAKKFSQERRDVSFHICGDCDDIHYRHILEDYQNKGYITYHGLQKDMNPFYRNCACYLYPSYYPEGMSNVLLEAAACGRPVIAADRAGCRETVDDGVSGYVVPVMDEEAVIRAVSEFLELPWEEKKKMGLAGRRKMEKEFDRQIVVQAYLEEIRRLS